MYELVIFKNEPFESQQDSRLGKLISFKGKWCLGAK